MISQTSVELDDTGRGNRRSRAFHSEPEWGPVAEPTICRVAAIPVTLLAAPGAAQAATLLSVQPPVVAYAVGRDAGTSFEPALLARRRSRSRGSNAQALT